MDDMEKKLRAFAKMESKGFSQGFSERVLEHLPDWNPISHEEEGYWTSLFWVFKRVSFAGAALIIVLIAINLSPIGKKTHSASGEPENFYSVSDLADGVSNQIYEVVF